MPGVWNGKQVTVQDVYEAVGSIRRRQDDAARTDKLGKCGLPDRRIMRGHVYRKHDGVNKRGTRNVSAG